MKKICSVICAAAIALSSMGGVSSFAAEEDAGSQIKYNYKFSMESDSEFKMVYGYNGGTISIKKSYVAGMYGNAMQITYPGHYISDPAKRYNGFVMQFKDDNIELTNESISMLDLMRDTQNISMWVHTPVTVDHGKGAVANRTLEMNFEFSTESGNVGYKKQFQLPNRGEWEYITIPASAFTASSVPMNEGIQADTYAKLSQVTIIFPYSAYFGTNPTEDTLETPWEEPLIIDEILFDRSTDDVKAITPPSTGEEEYFENANISGVLVNGVKVQGFDRNAQSNDIPVPASYTAEDIKNNVTVEVEAPTVSKTNKQQERTGALYVIDAPASVPGRGTVTVISGSRRARKNYNVNFTARSGMQPVVSGITVNGGNITVPVSNESASGTVQACALAVVKNSGGVCTSTAFAPQQNIAAGETAAFNFNVNTSGGSTTEVYIFNNENDYKLLCAPIEIGNGVMSYTTPSGTISESRVTFSDGGENVNINGTVTGTGTAFAVLKNSSGYIGAYTLDTANGALNASIPTGGKAYGKIYAILSYGNTVSRELYNATQSESSSCVRDFNSLASDDAANLAYFEKYKDLINLNNYLSGNLSSAEIADAVKAADKNVSALDGVRNNIGEELIVRLINKTNTADTLKEIYSGYNDIAKLDNSRSCFKKYITTDSLLSNVLDKTAANDYNSIGAVREAFNENGLLVAFGCVNGYGEIAELISGNQDILSKHFNSNSLSEVNSTDFYKYVAQRGINSLSDLNNLFTEYKNSSQSGVGNTGGMGSITGNGYGTGNSGVVSEVVGNTVGTSASGNVQEKSVFTDVSSNHWAYAAISGLNALGVVNGRGDGSFGPNDAVTREEFVKMLLASVGIEPEGADNRFSDVDENEWYAPYVNTAAQMGIVSGIDNDTFGVGKKITRQDMSTFIARYLRQAGYDIDSSVLQAFTDENNITDYAKDSVYALKNLGLINGMGNGSFMPKENATRAQSAVILYSLHSFAEPSSTSNDDLTGSERYLLLAEKFMNLDIIPVPQREDDIVTKGQFAKYIIGFVNFKSNDNAIEILRSRGYIDQNSDFAENSPITLGEAAVIMCRAMGYDIYAAQNGGSVDTYLSIAMSNEIIPSMIKSSDDALSFMDVLEIFDSASEAYVATSSFNSSKAQYKRTDITALYYFHKILVLDDIVHTVGTRTIDGNGALKGSNVRIGTHSFESDMQETFKYLGYRVDAFYSEDDETLKFIEPNKSNAILKIEGDLIAGFDGNVLRYFKDEKSTSEKRENISKAINRLYNYNYVSEYDKNEVNKADEIILIDSNNDGKYDTMNVIKEAIYCINQITPYETTLYDFYNQPSVKLADRESVIVYDTNETITTAGSIKVHDVLSIIEDKQKENVIIYIGGEEVDGDVTSVSYDDGKMHVGIDGSIFELTDVLRSQNTTAGLLSLGNSVSVLLDRRERIAYVEFDAGSSSSYNFAYLVRVLPGRFGDEWYLRLYTISGELETVKLTNKSSVNNTKIGNKNDVEQMFKNANTDPDSVTQLIRYKLNSSGEIQSVQTAQYIDADELYTTSNVFTRSADLTDIYYNANYRNFPGYARLSENTTIMFVPSSSSLMMDASNYEMRQFKDMKSATFDKVEIYNMSKDMVAGFAVIRSDSGGGTGITYSTVVAAVKEIAEVMVDDDERYELTLLYNGSQQKFMTAEGLELERQYKGSDGEPVTSTIDKGDLIRIAMNGNNEITDYHKIFDFDNQDDSDVVIRGNEYTDKKSYVGSSKTMIKFNGTAKNPDEDVVSGRIWQGKNPYWFTGVQYSTEFGIVKSITGTSMIIQIYPGTNGNNGTKNERYFNLTNKRVYILEDSREGVRLGSPDDIVPADLAGEKNASRVIISRHNDVPSIAAIVIR